MTFAKPEPGVRVFSNHEHHRKHTIDSIFNDDISKTKLREYLREKLLAVLIMVFQRNGVEESTITGEQSNQDVW